MKHTLPTKRKKRKVKPCKKIAILAFPFGVGSPDETGEVADEVWRRGGVRRRGEVAWRNEMEVKTIGDKNEHS